jgi:hypothetical protein
VFLYSDERNSCKCAVRPPWSRLQILLLLVFCFMQWRLSISSLDFVILFCMYRTRLLTEWIDQSYYKEADSHLPGQKVCILLWNPNVAVVSQVNPIHIVTVSFTIDLILSSHLLICLPLVCSFSYMACRFRLTNGFLFTVSCVRVAQGLPPRLSDGVGRDCLHSWPPLEF